MNGVVLDISLHRRVGSLGLWRPFPERWGRRQVALHFFVNAVIFVHSLHEHKRKSEGDEGRKKTSNVAVQLCFQRLREEVRCQDGPVASDATTPAGFRFVAETLDAQQDQVDRRQEVGHGFEVEAVKHDEQTNDGVQHSADAQSIHEGKERIVGFPVDRFVIVHQIVFGGKQRQQNSLHCKRQARDGLALLVAANFGLSHQIHHAERQQDGQCDDAVCTSATEGRPAEQHQTNDRANAKEHRVACDEGERTQLGRKFGGRVCEGDFFIRRWWFAEQRSVAVHDRHRRAGETGDDAAPTPCIGCIQWLEGVAHFESNVQGNKQRTQHVRQHLAVVRVPEVRNEEHATKRWCPIAVGDD